MFMFRSPADGEVENNNMSASRDSLRTTRSVDFDNQTTRSGESMEFINDRHGRAHARFSGKGPMI